MQTGLNIEQGLNNYQLDVATLAKGMYTIKVVYNGYTQTAKLVVQ
jgi:hypothetical protein